MAGFEGTQWASRQMRFLLKSKSFELMEFAGKVPAVSRSVHYGLFLAFEGIRFYCVKDSSGKVRINFFNWHNNLARLGRSMSYNLSHTQQNLIPDVQELEDIFIRFFKDPEMKEFCTKMAEEDAQGYLRPFTFDESQSIGVTFPEDPAVRAVVCRYYKYLGEPFSGVAIPHFVRAMGINGTGNLKLGINYLISVKAVDAAKQVNPQASSALFLDDQPHKPLKDRTISEWDSSCCLFALKDGTVVKIPESNLILPSVTIQGICALLRRRGVNVEERDMTYGELIERSKADGIVAICSIGTAGILNRAQKLLCIDNDGNTLAEQKADENHELYHILGQVRNEYWDIFREKAEVPEGMKLYTYEL